MILSAGQSLGHYTIVAPIGRGGMGEVYRARDGRLGRDVALKILREDGAGDPHRLRRFEQEARSASSLAHPNIVVVYEFGEAALPGESAPSHYLAMEMLEGQPLQTLLLQGPLPIRRVLDLGCQLADGLARAHESGIVHRDLKPSNIVVGAEGHAKILDFGLAKLREDPVGGADSGAATESPVDPTLTSPGALLGTVRYMSPEQARGEATNAASDQFALGCILYETVTGRAPFGRASTGETLSAILRDEPVPIAEVRPETPGPLCWIIERCLAKSAADRYVSTRDLARELAALRDHAGESGARGRAAALAAPRRRSIRRAAAALGLLALGAALVLLSAPLWRASPQLDFRRLTFRRGGVWRALFVPSSDAILYTASWEGSPNRSYLTIPEPSGVDRSLESGDQLPMAYTTDGSQVLVLLGRSRPAINLNGTLAWWPALGGQARPILQNAGWADWSDAADMLAVVRDAGSERILEVRRRNGELLRPVYRTVGAISYVRFSPDGKRIAFIHHPSRTDSAGEVRLSETGREVTKVLTGRFERCAGLDWNESTDEVWFTASRQNITTSTLFRVGDSGKPRPIQSMPGIFALQDVSSSGRRFLLISGSSGRSMVVRRRGEPPTDLTWLGTSTVNDISPDGKNLLFTDGGATEKSYGTWMRPIDGGDAVRLGAGTPGRFAPDGRSVVATTLPTSGPPQVVLIPVGPGAPRALTSSPAGHEFPSFAGPDTILFVRSEGGTNDVWAMSRDGSGARPLGAAGCDMPSADPSLTSFLVRCGEPKGAIHVFPLEKGPGRKLLELPGGEIIVSARWDRSGRDIFVVTFDHRILRVDAMTGKTLAHDAIDLGETIGPGTLRSGVLNDDASLQAFSFDRFSFGLYLADGL